MSTTVASRPAGGEEAGAPIVMGEAGSAMDRDEWVVALRRQFCKSEMIVASGDLNTEYFMPKTAQVTAKTWGDPEVKALTAGIAECGVGDWTTIKHRFLPVWKESHIRIKACKLLGRQSLDRYFGKKLSTAEISAAFEENKAEGLKSGRWRGGVLMEELDEDE